MLTTGAIAAELEEARAQLGDARARVVALIENPPYFSDDAAIAAWNGILQQTDDVWFPRGDRFYDDFIATGSLVSAKKAAIIFADCGDGFSEIADDAAGATVAAYMRQLAEDIGETVGEAAADVLDTTKDVLKEAAAGAAKGLFGNLDFGTAVLLAGVAFLVYRRYGRAS